MRLGVNAVILNPVGHVLLGLREKPPIWNTPGGGVEPDESPWHAAVRETQEEVGLLVEVIRLTGVYDRSPDGDPVLVFLCQAIGGELTTTEESTEVGWFPLDALPTPINPYQPARILDAARPAAYPVLRSQPGPSVYQLFPD